MEIPPPQIDLWDSNPVIRNWKIMKALKMSDGIGERTALESQGPVVRVKRVKYQHGESRIGKRAAITGFSEKSRWNLIMKTAVWDWHKIGPSVFVTLTYPDGYKMEAPSERNKHRYKWHRYLESWRGCNTPVLWRVEYAERKSGEMVGTVMPHWHMLILGVEYVPYQLVNEWWRKSIGREGYVRTDVRAVTNDGGVRRYLAKYLSKDATSNSLVRATYHNIRGRHWGVLREEEIPVHPRIRIERLTEEQIDAVYMIAEEQMKNVDSRCKTSFTAMDQLADDIREYLRGIGLDIDKIGG